MFKLESYISPLLMGYVDKYVKLRPEDFQLSLWGGDVVLNNLDLRLDVIEKAIHLPIVFKSGHIHELRIHVPWTKLGSEPVVITINTIECILKLRESPYEGSSKGSKSDLRRSKSRSSLKPRKQGEEDLPPGYLQSLMNKIVNNVSIIINNLIVKFVEDDIVLSLNIKSAEVYSADEKWDRDFIELSPPELVLRKSINLCDLTVCLDKCDQSGKIEHYQDPLIYRCSVTGRLYTKYDSVNAKRASVTKFDLFCEHLDVSLTDTQLPMFERLIELCMALYYGTLDPAKKDEGHDSTVHEEDNNITIEEESDTSSEVDQQGWSQWMWSYVPQILPENEEEGESDETTTRKKPQPPTLSIGMYGHKISVMFKLTEKLREKVHYGPQKIAFKPFILLEGEGIAVDILVKGLAFFDAQVGITHLKMLCQGQCICGIKDDTDTKSSVMVQGGDSLQDKTEANYYSNSLFDKSSPANQNEPLQLALDSETHGEIYTEQYSQVKFGAFFFDYLYVMADTEEKNQEKGTSVSSVSDITETLFMKENSLIRFIIGPCQINASSSSVHRFRKLLACAYNYNYEPYYKGKPENVNESRPHPTEEQIKILEEFIPTKTFHISLLQPVLSVYYAEHPSCDVAKKSYKTVHHQKGSKTTEHETVDILPCVHLTSARLEYQVTSSMYPRKLVQLISKMAAPSSNLLHHCHAHTQIKLFDFSAGLVTKDKKGDKSHVVTVIPPCSGALYTRKLQLTMYWTNSHIPKVEKMYELPEISINLNKANLLLILETCTSWTQNSPRPTDINTNSLMEDVFTTDDDQVVLPLLEVNVNGFEMKQCITSLVTAYTGTLSSVQVILYDIQAGSIIPVVCCPANTNKLTSTEYFQNPSPLTEDKNDFLTFTIQLPHEKTISNVPSLLLLNTEGVICAIDPSLSDWFEYRPKKKETSTEHKKEPVQVDQAIAQAAFPLQHMSQASSTGSVALDTTSFTKTKTHSRNRSTSQKPTNKKTDTKVKDQWGERLAAMFPLLRMLQVHIEVKSCAIFIHQSPLHLTEPSVDISQNLMSAVTSNTLPPTLVVCLPQIHITSSGMKSTSCIQEIPVNSMEGSLVGEKLPWRMVLNHFCVHTILSKQTVVPIIKPTTVSCTIGVTTKYNPPTSDNISSLGLCLHTDMHAVVMAISKPQVVLCTSLLNQLTGLFGMVMSLIKSLHKSEQTHTPTVDKPDLSEIALPEPTPLGQSRDYTGMTETETSDVTSREPTPNLDLEKSADKVKLSLWLQWTLPKLELRFYSEAITKESSRVTLTLDDLTLSLDVEQVYTKAKVKCGSCNAHIYHKSNTSNQWDEGPYLGILMTCQKEIPHDIHIISNKLFSTDQHTLSNFPSREATTRDVTHSFLNFTFTRALCKNVAKKMRKLNDDLADMGSIGDGADSHDLYFHKYICEVCLTIEPFDLIFQAPAVNTILDCFNLSQGKSSKSKEKKTEYVLKSNTPKQLLPILTAGNLPLIYINMSSVRLFMPKVQNSNKKEAESSHSGPDLLDQNILMACFQSLSVVPQADNPLPRHPTDKELYHRALHANLTHQPGSAIENRQYQIDVKGISMCTGSWEDFMDRVKHDGRLVNQPAVQIPALEWNTADKHFRKPKEDIELLPLVTGVDVKIVAAPAIVYQPPGVSDCSVSKILVCGHALEMNFTNDLDIYVSTNQVKLMSEITIQTMAKLRETREVDLIQETVERADLSGSGSEILVADSGIESDVSTITARKVKDRNPDVVLTPHDLDMRSKVITPLDILLTASRISVITYTRKQNKDQRHKVKLAETPDLTKSASGKHTFIKLDMPDSEDTTQLSVDPFLYVYISQPHTVLSCHQSQQKFEMSCYDVLVKGSSLQSVHLDMKAIPETTDFNVYWFETRPGKPHPKTGIPPSLYTLKVEDFFIGPASIHLRLDRPFKMNFSLDKIDHVKHFISEIVPKTKSCERPPRTEKTTTEHAPDPFQAILSKVSKFDLYTDQVIVAMETGDKNHGITGSLDWLSLETNFNHNKIGKTMEVYINMHLKNATVKTAFDKLSRTLVQPFGITIETDIQLYSDIDEDVTTPRSVVTLTTGLLSVLIGQEHIMCFDTILKELAALVPKKSKGDKHSTGEAEVKKTGTRPFTTDQTQDDLRQGQFTYVIDQDGISSKCDPGEIIFCNKDKDGNSHMTWCYHQPRGVSLVKFTPIPFNVPVKQMTEEYDEEQLIPCCLQYYDPATHNFINYIDFELSENEETSLLFPEIKADNARDITVAYLWRVVVYQGFIENSEQYKNDESTLAILPISLAAAMRVDSCYISTLVPVTQVCLSCPVIEVRLQNHPQHMGQDVPGKLKPFIFDDTSIVDEEFAVVTIKNLMITGHQLVGDLARICMQVSSNVGLSVVEMKHLTIHQVIPLTDVYCDVNFLQHLKPPALESNFNVGPLSLSVGQGIVHTLNCAVNSFSQITKPSKDRMVYSQYVICNDTSHTVRFGQVGTEENILLHSRQMNCYSWRSQKTKQELHMCLDGKIWKWCEAFDLDTIGPVVRVVKTIDRRYTVLIQIKQLSNSQKQIIIKGQFSLANRLSCDLDIEMQSPSLESGKIADVLPGATASHTYVLELDHNIVMKIRRKGKTLSWSKDILISKDKVPLSQMIYIPFVHESYIHVWCHVYEQITKGASRLLVMFCPLYVLRSHLPCSLFVSMAMPNLGKKKEVEMSGKGRSLQLELLGDAKYDLSFKLRSDTDKVDPALTLTPELINQVERKETKKCDFDKMLAMMNDQWSDKWPYTGYSISDESQSQKQPASELSDLDLSLPSIDLSLTLVEYWPGCSTVLIDVCPWCLLTNHSTLDLVFIDSSKVTWPLPQGKTFSPPKLQSSFSIGIVINGNLHQGGEIRLSEEAVADQRYRQDLGKTLYIDGYAQTQILVTSHQNMHVYFLTLQSKMVNGMRIVNIRETYCISNQTSIDLLLSHHSLQPCPRKFSVKCSDDNMRYLQSKSTDTTPLPSWAGYTMEDTENIHITFVNYVMIKPQTTNQNTASAERSSTYDDWSFPVRLVANENPGRVTVSIPVQTETVMSLPLCIVGQTRNGVSYFIVKEDNSPSCLLYNFTTVPIVYGYQNISISRAGYTTQEEAELTDILPTIPPNQHVFYTPSSTNRQFLLSIGDSGLPKIHVGVQQALETDESNTESKHSSDQDSGVSWSDPLDVNEEMERFISIPNNMNLKIKVIKVSMVTHVVINAANKAEVSAKEIRNKIGKVTTMEGHPPSEDTNVNMREYDVCVPKQDVFIHSNSITRNLELYISLHFHHLCLILQDETSSNNEITEVIRVSCDHLFLAHYPLIEGFDEDSPSHDCYSFSAENLQVDNQLYTTKGLYDFPVIFARQELKSKDKDFLVEFHSMNLSEKLAVIKSRSFAHIQVVMETDCLSHSLIKSVEIALEPVIGNVDDRFVYRMLEEVEKFLPTSLKDNKKGLKEITRLPQALKVMSHGLSSPIRIEHLVIHPCSLLISVHASLKVFIASDKTPLSFGKFDKKNVNSTAHQLTRVLAMHYASGALFRAGIVVGSLEILGNPTGLVRSIGSGVADLVRLPYGGLTQGPGAFVSGVSSGMSSFVRNISSGMLTSVTNFASSVSRNMERLSMDDTHRERQEERRRQHPEGLTSGLKNGLTGFGMSLLGAVAGLADQPLQNLMSRHESEGQRSAATELVSGVGKGLVGVFTKPIGGAAEFFSQTGQGLLYGTGLSGNIIKPCYPSDDMVVSDMFNSRLKYVRKLLQCLPKCQLQSSLLANYLDVMDTEVKVELLLTNELMIMISIDDDSQQQAFSLVELEVKVEPDNPQLITFVWRDSFHQDVPQVSVGKVKVGLTLVIDVCLLNLWQNASQAFCRTSKNQKAITNFEINIYALCF
ncbi:intermembrane lipid transfer protein VPS13B-like isoform X1 [Mytilus californianus]|uniref:intermembrane lipid transfer protein VPS13B-like isoform X1 n=3 Tax=Mytilus californianus TaxID=6549 RepID=UPI0022455701|nr:intermembrane lipid transfer protein VPS13B-like isoform X1 [Mytilus californianus]